MELNDLPKDLFKKIRPRFGVLLCLMVIQSNTYLPKLDKYMPRTANKSKWNAQDRATATFENGGKIVCLSYEVGRKKFQGKGVKLVWIDEEGSDDQKFFQECLLRTVDLNYRVVVTATPVDGFNCLFDQFVEEIRDGYSRIQISGLITRSIASNSEEPSKHMTESMQRTRLFGDFVSQEGLVYDEFDPRYHVVEAV